MTGVGYFRVARDRDDEAARESHSRMMRDAGDHGTNGKVTWTREGMIYRRDMKSGRWVS